MFDIAFSELLLIGIIALIVIGPQRLPRVARTVGHLLGRMQRYVSDVKADIAREVELDDLRRVQASMEEAARSMQDSINQGVASAHSELGSLAQSAQAAAEPYHDAAAPQPPAAQQQLDLGLATPHEPGQPTAGRQE